MDIYGHRAWGGGAAPGGHLYLLAALPHLVVVVDGEHPETPGVLLVPDTTLPAGRVTVGSYHRLGGVRQLEIIGHGPEEDRETVGLRCCARVTW